MTLTSTAMTVSPAQALVPAGLGSINGSISSSTVFYPSEQTWRVNVALALLIPALAPILFDKMPGAKHLRWFSLAYPVVATFLLIGGVGLEEVPTHKFGGFMLNVTVGLAGIVLSLPIGIVLALGRRSRMPIVRVLFASVHRNIPRCAVDHAAVCRCDPLAYVFASVI